MKLPKVHLSDGALGTTTSFIGAPSTISNQHQLVQLHCLRSIAVNLEVLISMFAVQVEDEELVSTLLGIAKYHSVAERKNTDEATQP